MTAPRIHLVVAFAADRTPALLHLSTDARAAEEAFRASAEAPDAAVAVQLYKFPSVHRRKILGEFASAESKTTNEATAPAAPAEPAPAALPPPEQPAAPPMQAPQASGKRSK